MPNHRLLRLSLTSALGCLVSLSPAMSRTANAQAASPTAGPTRLDEIVVTAQKRVQSVNDVGLSITTATGNQLKALGVQSTGDLVKVTPGLTFSKSQDGTPLFTIRGVGFNDYTLGASPAVSVYVDQVPLAYSQFTQGATLDLQRVEVLKGPQGILFGQNSTGGAINYIANKPTRDLEAGVGVSYGNFDTFTGDAYISGPLTDTLGLRLAVGTANSGPWQKNIATGQQLGRQDAQSGRLLLDWKPTDRLDFLFSVSGWVNRSDTQAGQLEGLLLQSDASTCVLCDPPEVARRVAALEAQPLAPQDARAAAWDNASALHHDDNFVQLSLRADAKLADHINLTSITAYSQYDEAFGVDRDGTVLIDAEVFDRGRVNSFSQELRLSGKTGRLNWLVGGNVAANNVVSADDIGTKDATNTAILVGGPYIALSTTRITQRIRDYAAFANAEYAVTDRLTVLGGVRYTEDDTAFTSCMTGDIGMQTTFAFLSNYLSGAFFPGGPPIQTAGPSTCLNMNATTFRLINTPYAAQLNENNVSWRVGANYKPNRDTLLYVLASRGYKSGSFPTVPASTTAQFAPVTQESVTAYEAGAKITALDRKVQVNGAVFYYQYDNKQVRGLVIDPVFNQLEKLVNIPKSRIDGGEVDVTAKPLAGLTLRAAVTYLSSRVQDFTGINNARVFANYAGSALPFTPNWYAVADAEYEWPVNDRLNAFIGGNLLYNSPTNSTLGNPSSSYIRGFTTLDLRGGVRAADGRWSLMVWGRNVTNQYYWSNQFVTQDVIVRYAAMPATYGVTFRVDFR